mgnify:CR=1 FL=1
MQILFVDTVWRASLPADLAVFHARAYTNLLCPLPQLPFHKRLKHILDNLRIVVCRPVRLSGKRHHPEILPLLGRRELVQGQRAMAGQEL